MKPEDVNRIVAVVAIFIAIIALGIVSFGQQQAPAGVSYDPARQPMLLPLRELTASTEAASGIIMDYQKINTSGATGSPYIGQLVSLSGTTWIVANPTSALNGKLGMVIKAPASNTSATGQVMIMGVVRNSSWTLTKGTVYYANATTPGTFGTVKSADSAVIQPVGWAYDTNVLFFNPAINATANGL